MLGSRKEVDERGYTFPITVAQDFPDAATEMQWRGVIIMASNMDGVGTFEIADILGEQGLFTCYG